MLKLEYYGTLNEEEVKELMSLEGIANTFGDLGKDFLKDVFMQLTHLGKVNYEVMEDGEAEIILLDDPKNTAAAFRDLFEKKKKEEKISKRVGNAVIRLGTTVGRFELEEGSVLPVPKPSLPKHIRAIYDEWKSNGTLDSDNRLIRNVEINSANIAVGLSLGYSANSRLYIPEEMSWD